MFIWVIQKINGHQKYRKLQKFIFGLLVCGKEVRLRKEKNT
jgi:hypothetical protein